MQVVKLRLAFFYIVCLRKNKYLCCLICKYSMNTQKQAKAAVGFAAKWAGKGYEKGESQSFWLDLLNNVFGIEHPTEYIKFEQQVKLDHTAFIDGYIPSTHVMIEQKSIEKDLGAPIKQSDGRSLTPFQQAKRYAAELPYSQRPRWIVTCNFREFWIYDMEQPKGEPQKILLENLGKEYYRLQFLVDEENERIRREEEISMQAGELVGKLYDALYKEYINPNEDSLRSLNILCVRIVFCLYAEDAGLFETRTSFEDYVKSFNLPNLRKAIIDLFKGLDTKLENRDKYDTALKPFPYVNGGLFRNEQIEIPNFTQEIVDVIVNHCATFDWSEISPTIFGSVFESTLNPDTRRKGGMHYTSIANIHKLIDPLFMDDLEAEFDAICKTTAAKTRNDKLFAFQKKLGSLKFLDPACGSGNFLTETYISLRRLENKVISILNKGEKVLGFNDEFIKVSISQFYGIEINDFAVTVAMTALWIAECQMMEETEKILGMNLDFLPLKNHANIVEGNALKLDWSTLDKEEQTGFLYADKLNIYKLDDGNDFKGMVANEHVPEYGRHYKELNVVAKEIEEKELPKKQTSQVVYDYIMGNPPFVGARMMSKEQKNDVIELFGNIKNVGNLDYVSCWYKKAADYMKGKFTRAALVSTNSISQGEQVAILWKSLFDKGIHIDFAWRTFRWDSESEQKAHVHCVIIGFSYANSTKPKMLYFDEKQKVESKDINGYLLDAPNIFIESRHKPLCNVPPLLTGSQRIDNDYFMFTDEEKKSFLKEEPLAEKYFKVWYGADEFLYNRPRWCLYLGNCTPSELRKMKKCMEIVESVKQYRLESKREATIKAALYPYRFGLEVIPTTNFIIVPVVSSEKRKYIPIGFMTPDNLCSNQVNLIPDANLYDFGILTSKLHNVWVQAVCGRLKSDYRYSKDIVYNNFPWPTPTEAQKAKIEQTAQAIFDARAKYPDSTLADLYDERTMPIELRKAHDGNDKAVMQAYGFSSKMTDSEIVAELFRMYERLIKNN